MFIATATSRIVGGLASGLAGLASNIYVLLWDTSLAILNLFAFNRKVGHVILQGNPGYGGKWPVYIAPQEGDSRSCCPALNAMANHGILPRDGKNIPYTVMSAKIQQTFNFAPSFCYFVPKFLADMLSRDYYNDTISLSDLNVHNGIEHDASLLRHDVYHQPDQGKPAIDLIDGLLKCATGPNNTLTVHDMSVYSSKRRRDARANNPQFSLSTFHKVFGSSNSSTLLLFFGGRVSDLEVFLKEERFPEGWEPSVRSPWGLTMATFQGTVLAVELGIDESKGVKL